MKFNINTRSVIGVIYMITIIYFLLFASFRTGTNTDVNLVPFAVLVEDFYYIFLHGSSVEYILFLIGGIVGNLLLLFPIPYFFDIKLSRLAKWCLMIFVPVIFESLQYILQVGSADIDDVLLNTSGFAVGIWSRKRGLFKRFLPRSEQY